MYNEQIEKLIDLALADGVLTEKEKQILFKKAEAQGIDLDEFEMVLDGKLHEKVTSLKAQATSSAAPKSDKLGDVKKCPGCGAIAQSFQSLCEDCGHEFRNIESVNSAQKLFDMLQGATLRNSQMLSDHDAEKRQRLETLSQKHNSDGTLVKIFAGKSRSEAQDEEREDLIRELDKGRRKIEKDLFKEKANIIKNFPVPNSKEDLLELLAMSSSNAYDNDGYVGDEEEVWIQKTDQLYSKIKIVAQNDKAFLEQATNMIVSLMKKLPRKYKNFTTLPESLKAKISSDLEQDKKRKRETQIKVGKPYAIGAGIALLIFIIGLAVGPLLTLLGFVALIVCVSLGVKKIRNANEITF